MLPSPSRAFKSSQGVWEKFPIQLILFSSRKFLLPSFHCRPIQLMYTLFPKYSPPPWVWMNSKMFTLFREAAWCAGVRPLPSFNASRELSPWKRRTNSSRLPASAACGTILIGGQCVIKWNQLYSIGLYFKGIKYQRYMDLGINRSRWLRTRTRGCTACPLLLYYGYNGIN